MGVKVRGEQARHSGRQSRQQPLLKAARERARRHFKLRTATTHNSLSSFQLAKLVISYSLSHTIRIE
jgi:hypothetical protein